ncbi:DEAH boxpolypeptide 36 [Rhodotorula toruloides]|uniref:DEAH boxpolypeptide 36 n=1 Tax=Rhodotorula toruloides TaxID=5286 RepID=A0A511KRR9_RHOTO|nr:DEAH boxpolypeptide 36 [Rhodotorula toruloides]
MDGAQVDTGDAGTAAQVSRAASPTAVAQPNTDSSPVIEHYASLLGALMDSVRGIMSSYKVPVQQASPLDEASNWRTLRLSLRSRFGSPSSAFVADAASIYTGTVHRPKERAAHVVAAMERIGPAKLAEGCIELEREAFGGVGGQAKSTGRQAWYGAAEAISWLYAVRSAFLWDGASDISPAQPTNPLPSHATAPPAPFGFHSAPPISSAPVQQPPPAPLAFGFAPPPAPGLIAKQQEEKKMRLAASMSQPNPVPAAAPSRPTFWPTPAASASSAPTPAPTASNPSPQPFASQAPSTRPAPFVQPTVGASTSTTSKAAPFASAMTALSSGSPASTSALVVPTLTPAVAPSTTASAVPIAISSTRKSPAPAAGSSHSTPAPIFETPPVLPTGPPSAGFAPPPSAPGPPSESVVADVKPKIRKQRASTGGIGTKKGKAKREDDDAGYLSAGARRAAANGGRAGSERPQRKRKVPLRLQDETEDARGEYDSWEEGWGGYLEDGAGAEKKKRRRTFSGFDDPSDDDEDFDDAELDVEELDELGSDYEEEVARKKAKKAKAANGAGGAGRGGRKRGSLAGGGLAEQEQAEEDERLLNDPDRFKIGQAVMAKFPNYNFWPSVVLDHRIPPPGTQGKRTPGAYLVKSVPTGGDHRWVSPDDSSIVPLTPTQLDDIILARYKSAPPTSWQKWRGELVDAALLIKDPEKLKEWLAHPTPAELYQLEQAEKKRAKRMSAFY